MAKSMKLVRRRERALTDSVMDVFYTARYVVHVSVECAIQTELDSAEKPEPFSEGWWQRIWTLEHTLGCPRDTTFSAAETRRELAEYQQRVEEFERRWTNERRNFGEPSFDRLCEIAKQVVISMPASARPAYDPARKPS